MRTYQTKYSDHVLTVTLSRPKALNALNLELMDGLHEIIRELYQNDDTRGIILTGDGDKSFVAGADIKELAALTSAEALALSRKGQEVFRLIEESPKPIIAAVNGIALGGGCELAMACHLRVASENATFGQPEATLGIIPGYGGTQRLAQLVGRGKALELMLTGEAISAQEAYAIGLVNHIVSGRDELMNLASNIMKKIMANGPIAVSNIIKSVNAGNTHAQQGYATEAENFAACADSEDFKEGTIAFIQKRKPKFKGV
jgi:enoyl-CoA hydratase